MLTLDHEKPFAPGMVRGLATWNAWVSESELKDAVAVKSPVRVTVSRPEDDMEAGAPADTDHVEDEVTSRDEPSLYFAVAVRSMESPGRRETPGAEMAML